MTLPLMFDLMLDYFFLNFLRIPDRPTSPDPNKRIVAGSGTGATGAGSPDILITEVK